jgi:Zn finger protein HypA/HybF involved in hydrogenase expression
MAAVTAAAYGACASAYVSQAAQERAAKAREIQEELRAQLESSNAKFLRSDAPATKCPGCGSHTYELMQGASVCSYCRTPRSEV